TNTVGFSIDQVNEYWVESTGSSTVSVYKQPNGGGSQSLLVSGACGCPPTCSYCSLPVGDDESALYWRCCSPPSIVSVCKTGTAGVQQKIVPADPMFIVTDQSYVYWNDASLNILRTPRWR